MRLTVFTDYALRVLMYLALTPDQRVTIRDIASAYDISRNHLMKVVNNLTRAELIVASRGIYGGISLARPAGEITVGEVIRGTEEDFALVECFRPDGDCRITPTCQLQHVFAKAHEQFMAVLDDHTLAHLVEDKAGLSRLLSIEETTA